MADSRPHCSAVTDAPASAPGRAAFADLHTRLSDVSLRDEARLRRRLEGARKARRPDAIAAIRAQIAEQINASAARVSARRANVPLVTYPEQLPVSRKRDEIRAAIQDHQVVIVAGETGSGKTTQLPKICLELGRGVRGVIGHTQPRRLAARTVAERIAEELKTPLGSAVGYKVRFTDHSGDQTNVKLMTDGILLAELQHDRDLLQYDTLIIDEAHERSLNIDFILGYLKQLLPRRPDLKVIITSATIDAERFADHFGALSGGQERNGRAPIIEVSGRTYPVEVRYRPIVDLNDPDSDADRDQIQAICDAVEELDRESPGDVLVFLSGEREIRDTADALNRLALRNTEVLPLYARLSTAEQHRVFQQHAGRRIVLATNVAETSLTVPGIKYVIDPGTARISRYSHRLKVQRLPIEPVSQASANQRAGRCGRTSDGICIRLYSESDYTSRPLYTEPEILRTNLASVILAMTSIGLGDIAAFPFVEAPDRRNIRDGLDLLHELGAVEAPEPGAQPRLTDIGRQLARLPVDPRLARMVVEAARTGCMNEVLVITSALSIQDPRERPSDRQQQATQAHARFTDKEQQSDFLTYLRLWEYLQEKQRELSSNQFRKLCKNEYLHYLRVREWQDLHAQLRQVAKDLGVTPNTGPADPALVHQALLSGLLSHIGMYEPEKREYIGARNARFAVFPGSSLFKKSPRWLMAAEVVETSRLWGRIAARIEPQWAEALAEHLVKRGYSEPHWSTEQGAVLAYEKVTLYGLPIVAQRRVNYGRIDPQLSRELFIRHALVQGEWRTHHEFFQRNRKLLGEVEELENRARRRDIAVHDDIIFAFYDQRVGKDVVSAAHFDQWWKQARREQPQLLDFDREMLVNRNAGAVLEEHYPDVWRQGKLRFELTYQFEPGADADGVTVHVPLAVLNQVEPDGFDWQIPGLREELVTELIRSLPKPIRRSFVPAPNYAKALLDRLPAREGPLLDGLEREMRRMGAAALDRSDWDLDRVPEHLKMTFRVVDERGRKLAEDKDLESLKLRLKAKVRESISAAADDVERTGLRTWEFGTLARVFEQRRRGVAMKAYPALVDEGGSVGVKLLDTVEEQEEAMRLGTRRLLLLNVVSPTRSMLAVLDNREKLALGTNPYGPVPKLFEDCVACAADYLIERHGGPAWDKDAFTRLRDKVREELAECAETVVKLAAAILAPAHELDRRLRGPASLSLLPSLNDARAQLASLVRPGFISQTGYEQLAQLPRYLRALGYRLDKMTDDPYRDQANLTKVQQLEAEYAAALQRVPRGRGPDQQLRQARWMLEELRVSLFAQQMRTAYPVSEKRIRKALGA
ncbi:ATP-dependent RNA helicase HrpA [Actinocrinis puniceicyclus]|uniref:RNA helicase n=1 Tax=Actinocrinis puniceicyclus TaxID=977794 RepID=A0A8J7WR19_9ACTN|nr:ATP-dependent RNA helicase HrpA [Actinocrinis puniceicyclus]MBS2965135.1 ATP-dependent RNA helicase HrpA [Actinocrinis puniceicyclus]